MIFHFVLLCLIHDIIQLQLKDKRRKMMMMKLKKCFFQQKIKGLKINISLLLLFLLLLLLYLLINRISLPAFIKMLVQKEKEDEDV
jgi:hypothetical protein